MITLNQDRKKKQTFISLFILGFIIYAISPFFYSVSCSNGEQISYVQQDSNISFKNVRIYFFNIIFSNFDNGINQNHATSQILIKKARAVLQSPTDMKIVYLDSSKISEYFSVFNSSSWFNINNQKGVPKQYENFLSLFSGLSPPSV